MLFFAVFALCWTSSSAVIVIKIGIVPNGLIKVKNEVKLNIPKAIITDIINFFFLMLISKKKSTHFY